MKLGDDKSTDQLHKLKIQVLPPVATTREDFRSRANAVEVLEEALAAQLHKLKDHVLVFVTTTGEERT